MIQSIAGGVRCLPVRKERVLGVALATRHFDPDARAGPEWGPLADI